MKCMFWKCSILAAALGILMALGALAEGTLGLAATAACILGAVYAMRWFWAMEQRAERQAALRRRKAQLICHLSPILRRPPRPHNCHRFYPLFRNFSIKVQHFRHYRNAF